MKDFRSESNYFLGKVPLLCSYIREIIFKKHYYIRKIHYLQTIIRASFVRMHKVEGQ